MFDCCIVNNEMDLLDIRMHTLDSVVEKFVVVESNLTHSGKPKRMYFSENRDRFSKFDHKIIHLVYPGQPIQSKELEEQIVWYNENEQRNFILESLKVAQPIDGILFISDADEIVRPEKLLEGKELYLQSGSLVNFALEQCMYYLNYNFKGFKQIRGSMLYNEERAKYIHPKIFGAPDYRVSALRWHMVSDGNENDFPTVMDAGWHFSTLGNPDNIRYKIESNAHRFCDTEEYKNKARIQQCINEGTHVYDMDRYKDTKLVKREWSFMPEYVQQNFAKFSHLIKF